MDAKGYLKLVLDDRIISINMCEDEEVDFFYLIRHFEESYGVLLFMIKENDIHFMGGWDYKQLSSAKRKAKGFYNEYEKIDEKSFKKWLTTKNIML